jgi:hypothetical protein
MILPLSLVAVALAILLLLLYLDGGHRSSAGSLRVEDLAAQTRPVDIGAFRNLVDPKEDAFLRANLCTRDFRAIQRERARSAMEYLQSSAHNATYLLRMGEAAIQNHDPRIAQAGRQLVDSALQLRGYALLYRAQLYLRLALPGAQFSYGKLADNYQQLSSLASQLALIQHPTQAARFSALL